MNFHNFLILFLYTVLNLEEIISFIHLSLKVEANFERNYLITPLWLSPDAKLKIADLKIGCSVL